MYEFGIDEFTSLSDFPGDKKSFGAKPMMIFLGSQWELDATYQKLQNLFLDLFRGFKPDKISLQGIDHVITCAVHDSKIYIRTYFVNYQKSNTQVPNISLQPMGPFLDLTVRRSKTAADDLWKLSIRRPKTYVSLSFTSSFFCISHLLAKILNRLVPKKVKNIERNTTGDKVGRIHIKKQNFDKLGGRRMAALRDGNTKKRGAPDSTDESNGGNKKKARV